MYILVCINQLFVYNLLADAPDPSGHGGSCNTGNKARNFFKPGKNRDAIRSLFKVICLHDSCLFTILQLAILSFLPTSFSHKINRLTHNSVEIADAQCGNLRIFPPQLFCKNSVKLTFSLL